MGYRFCVFGEGEEGKKYVWCKRDIGGGMCSCLFSRTEGMQYGFVK
jgi:hypothetical protein